MPAPENTLKKRLQAGETCVGCWLGMGDAYVAEIAATAGFDWLLIDGEHAPNDIRSLLAQLSAIDSTFNQSPSDAAVQAASPVIRVVDDNPAGIKQVLDIGCQSLMVPMVATAEQAARAVAATRYPPEGIRGVGAALARASAYSAITDYLTTANSEICLLLQVESRAGLEALDEILAVDGVDGVFIGPSDLAADMGYLGDPGRSEVREAVLDALARIRAAGRIAGVVSTDDDYIEACRQAGANFLGVDIDVVLYARTMRARASTWR